MTTKKSPLAAQMPVTTVKAEVSAEYGGAGVAVGGSSASASVLLHNTGRWPIEYRVGAADWKRLELRNTARLSVDLSNTEIRARKAEFAASGELTMEIEGGVPSSFVAGDVAVNLGGGGSFTELSDAPSSIVPLNVLAGTPDGSALQFVPFIRDPVDWATLDPNVNFASGSIAIDGEPWASFEPPGVGDSILNARGDAQDAGIWVITAINGNTASVTRRADSVAGKVFFTGEVITVKQREAYATFVVTAFTSPGNFAVKGHAVIGTDGVAAGPVTVPMGVQMYDEHRANYSFEPLFSCVYAGEWAGALMSKAELMAALVSGMPNEGDVIKWVGGAPVWSAP